MKLKLNGWQRLWVVFTVIWAPAPWYWGSYADWLNLGSSNPWANITALLFHFAGVPVLVYIGALVIKASFLWVRQGFARDE